MLLCDRIDYTRLCWNPPVSLSNLEGVVFTQCLWLYDSSACRYSFFLVLLLRYSPSFFTVQKTIKKHLFQKNLILKKENEDEMNLPTKMVQRRSAPGREFKSALVLIVRSIVGFNFNFSNPRLHRERILASMPALHWAQLAPTACRTQCGLLPIGCRGALGAHPTRAARPHSQMWSEGKKSVTFLVLLLLGLDFIRSEPGFTWCFLTIPCPWPPLPFFRWHHVESKHAHGHGIENSVDIENIEFYKHMTWLKVHLPKERQQTSPNSALAHLFAEPHMFHRHL